MTSYFFVLNFPVCIYTRTPTLSTLNDAYHIIVFFFTQVVYIFDFDFYQQHCWTLLAESDNIDESS